VLEAMLSSPVWIRMPLTVTFFDADRRRMFRMKSESNVMSEICENVSVFTEKLLAIAEQTTGRLSCASCVSDFITHESRVVRCPGCASFFHARCGAAFFKPSGSVLKELIPNKGGECPVCFKKVKWADLVRLSFVFGSGVESDGETEGSSLSQEESAEEESCITRSSLRDRLFEKTGDRTVFKV
jgi:DNA-directed RNA polymerase subunit RPC12/RpoP